RERREIGVGARVVAEEHHVSTERIHSAVVAPLELDLECSAAVIRQTDRPAIVLVGETDVLELACAAVFVAHGLYEVELAARREWHNLDRLDANRLDARRRRRHRHRRALRRRMPN